MPARVGIVIRTRHRPDFLRRALEDVAAQSCTDVRVVVVNDGGDSVEVDRILDGSPVADRARAVHLSAGQGGRCRAANAGVARLATEYIVLHDDDDAWHPDFLARTMDYLDAHPAHAAVAVATEIVYEERRGESWVEVGRAPFWAGLERISLAEMLVVNRAVPISMLYRRELHDRVGGYDESLEAVEDWEFYLRVLRQADIGYLAGDPLAFWTQRPRAHGTDANSMFALAGEHARDDAIVRDRALAAWTRVEGDGLPLYMARLQTELIAHLDRRLDDLHEKLRADIRADIGAHQPVLSRLRRLRRRFGRR